jgi:hypothetical protein
MKKMNKKDHLNGKLIDWVLNIAPRSGLLIGAWTLFVSLFFEFSLYSITFLILMALSIAHLRENLQFLNGPGNRFINYLKTKYELLPRSVPSVMKTASEICQEELDFSADDFYLGDEGIIDLDLDEVGGRDPTNFNYKVKIRVENDTFVIAELDSDSHISLISESYFNRLSELTDIKCLPEEPMTFKGSR